MTTFPVFDKASLDAQQRALWDELTLGSRGFYTGGPDANRLPDLYNAWLQFPEFLTLMLRLGDALRARTELPGKLRELLVLTVSARLHARVEYDFHVPFARSEGLADDVIAAIGAGTEPPFTDDVERITYDAILQLLQTATLTGTTREALVVAIGYPGLMQLMGAVMLYVVTAYTSNVADVQLAKDFSADPQQLKDFYAGKR